MLSKLWGLFNSEATQSKYDPISISHTGKKKKAIFNDALSLVISETTKITVLAEHSIE